MFLQFSVEIIVDAKLNNVVMNIYGIKRSECPWVKAYKNKVIQVV